MKKTLISSPGIYRGFPVDAYFADPCPGISLNQSLAKVILDQSPRHAWQLHPRLNLLHETAEPEEYKKAMAIGNAVHAMFIERGKGLAVVDAPDWRTKEAKAARSLAIEEGKEPILREHYGTACNMARSLRVQLDRHQDRSAFTNGSGEVVIAWEEDGFWFRCMVDWLSNDLRTVDDLKTTGGSASQQVVSRKMADDGWHIQAAMAERGLDRIDPAGAGRRRFRFTLAENYEPFALTVATLPESVMHIGRRQLNTAIEIWKSCLSTDTWNPYSVETFYPEFPGYLASQWEAREMEMDHAADSAKV